MKPLRRPMLMTPTGIYNAIRNHGRVLHQQVSFGALPGTNKEFDRNIQCSKAAGTTPGVANTEFAVNHSLNRVPVTFFGHTDNGGVIYKSTTPWTKTQIFLKCTTASANFGVVII